MAGHADEDIVDSRLKASDNMLFRRLPAAERSLVEPLLERFPLEFDAVLCAAGGPIAHAIFPVSGIISLVARNDEGASFHGPMIGRDGMFGLPLAAGLADSPVEARVRGGGESFRIEAGRFRQLMRRCPVLGQRIQRSALRMIDQLTQIALCNGHHTVEARSARWILSISDRMGSDRISLKQSSLASMLGVLRPSVSQAAGALRAGALIDYRRGEMNIVDRSRLEALACSCYPIIATSYASSLI